MSGAFDLNPAILIPIGAFLLACALCYLLRRNGWVWPPRILLLGLIVICLLWIVQASQAADDDWSGTVLVMMVMFVVAPTWLGALLGADLGRRHHAKARLNLVPPR